MAYTMYNGSTTEGDGFREVGGLAVNVLEAISLGNSAIYQQDNATNRFLDKFIKEVPAVPGEQVPVETWNIFFSPGGITSDAPEFQKNRAHFNLKKESFKVLAYKFNFDMVKSSRNTGINLMQGAVEKTQKARDVFAYVYNPYIKLASFISGDSSSTTLPVLNDGGTYVSQMGVLRGEDCTDLLNGHVKVKTKNLLKAKKSTVLSANDINDMVQDLKDFKSNVGKRIVGVGSPRSLWELKNTYAWAQNVDTFVEDGIPMSKVAGVNLYELEGAPDGFLIFLVEGGDAPVIKAVEKDPMQRGLVMNMTKAVTKLEEADDLDGAFLEISPEGYHFLRREKIGILDITNADGNGLMTATGVATLEDYLVAIRGSWLVDY
jgi:hypothetical protein